MSLRVQIRKPPHCFHNNCKSFLTTSTTIQQNRSSYMTSELCILPFTMVSPKFNVRPRVPGLKRYSLFTNSSGDVSSRPGALNKINSFNVSEPEDQPPAGYKCSSTKSGNCFSVYGYIEMKLITPIQKSRIKSINFLESTARFDGNGPLAHTGSLKQTDTTLHTLSWHSYSRKHYTTSKHGYKQ